MSYLERPDGCRLYFELHGDAERSPLLLLEGLGGDIPGWRRNIPHLAQRHRVIALDHRGNGRSDKPDRPMAMATFVEDSVGLLDHLGVRSAHVYGQSFGGMVAQELALTHPDRVRSLVLGATSPGPRHAARPDHDARVPKDKPYLALYSDAFALEHPDHVADDILVGSQSPQPPHAGRRQWEAMQEFDSFHRLNEISVPTLILHGTEDRLVPVANARLLADRIPGARLVLLEGTGHVYHSERADESDAAVLEFLDRLDGERP
jgi:pimeloyl-ACP methyl ester carboxylesterase